MARIEFICSFDGMEQEVYSGPFNPEVMASKRVLSASITDELDVEHAARLNKVSCCVYSDEGENVPKPDWYMNCNGKLWYNHGYLEP
jgi:hypothetical protein